LATTPIAQPHPTLLQRFHRWRNRDHETLAAYSFLLPNIVGFLLFSALPVVAALVLSFYDWDLLLGASFIGLGNFRKLLFDDRVFHAAFVNTFYFALVSVPLSVGVGLAMALLTNQALRGITAFRGVYLLPYVTITVALALVWKWLYLPEIGLVNQVLALFGISGPAWLVSPVWAMPALIIMSVWRSFGYNMVLFLAGLQGIPTTLYEAAMIDGANAWHRFWKITLPLLSPAMFLAVVLTVISSFQVFDQAFVMTAGGPSNATNTIVLYIFQNGFLFFKMGYASAIAWALFAVIFTFTLIQMWLQRHWVQYE
jgi:multiple sugar transport system permease protein